MNQSLFHLRPADFAAGHCRKKIRPILSLLLAVGFGVIGVQSSSGDSPGFSYTGSLATARYAHTATLLPNGKVLVAGGNSSILTAELYDPATGTWSPTGSATTGSSTATLLQNGQVLVVGAGTASAQLYDPMTGSWSTTGSLKTTRLHHTATLLPNGKVLVAGGYNTSGTDIAAAELYDPATGTWSTTGKLATARDNHTATLLPNGKVLVAAGYIFTAGNFPKRLLDSAELYNPATGTWSATGALNTARDNHSATLLPEGTVLVAGGAGMNLLPDAELYDPATGEWNTTGSLAIARASHSATLLPDGKVLAVGGLSPGPDGYASTAELYDPTTGSWSAAGDLRTARTLHTATLLGNGKVLVAGGFRNVALASAELNEVPAAGFEQLQNIATRVNVLTGDNVMIAGFIINGNAPKKLVLRAIGPSLSLANVLADPSLELHFPNGTVVTNDNWKINDQTGQSQEAEIDATHLAPTNSLESAMVQTLAPGSYTAIMRGQNGGTGIGLIEAYDVDQGAASQLANISTRGFVDTGDNVMIGGFILGPDGSGAGQVIVRARGPSLFVPGTLFDPTLELHNGNGDRIASNDNWKINDATGQSQEAEIRSTTLSPPDDLESAIVSILPPGSYTTIVAGKNGATGVGLVEVYRLQ